MSTKVRIIEKESNKLIAEYPIVIVDYPAGNDAEVIDADAIKLDYFDEAWENAIEDGLVDTSNRADYDFVLADVQKLEHLTNPPNDDHSPNP